ncbi:MAG TPA: hypothetical protein VIS10_18405 [Anaerolineales bacterium]
MLRRIELIHPAEKTTLPDDSIGFFPAIKLGLMGSINPKIVEAWSDKLRGPGKRQSGIRRNARFYFTELGWKEVGRKVVEACQQVGQEYRVIKVKEGTVNVVWRDRHYGLEVAAQPRKRRHNRR